ncbi:MAG: NAD-dependent epimerase/dehydratase family protein [Bryobacterales bacterium]|nr:NAD-dependent epimerase/dehydratase family protein [Bryobacterales bacterium]
MEKELGEQRRPRKVLVIGGTLFIGRRLVAELLKAGHEVWVLHRRPEHNLGKRVGNLVADRNDVEAVRRILSEHKFEVVFDNVYDWERGTTAAHVEAAARAAAHSGLHRYVFMSSVAAYGDGLNHHEGDALAPDEHPDPYVRNKAMSERALFRLHQRSGIPVVTLRPPFVYGPGNPFYREAFFWDRLRDNRPLILPGDGRRLMQFVYVKDLVWACLRVLEVPAAAGQAFNIANPRAITQAELIAALADAAGKKATVVRIPREKIHQAGGRVMSPPYYFGAYFDLPPITMLVTKAQRILGFQATPFGEGLRETYRWYLRHSPRVPIDYSFEDRLLACAQTTAAVLH